MELKIKYILPYIEFNLQAEMLDYQCDYIGKRVDTIKGCEQWDKSGELWSFITEGGSKPGLGRIKPLLRPLEDLNKVEFGSLAFALYLLDYLPKDSYGRYIVDDLLTWEVPAKYLRSLYKNRFDVMGLIEEGLAHDLNTFTYE